MKTARTKLIHELRKAILDPMLANHCEVPKLLAEKAVFEIERLLDENARLREGLSWIECEPLNAEYMARNILDGLPPHHNGMVACEDGNCACKARGE